ncbi:MAG: nitroreductase family protein [Anaerolineales bacterium]|nr:nitroreductase family protein [Anaerolineales bacterium]
MDESLIDLLFSRRSIRKYKPQPIPQEAVRRMLEAAHAAPSAHGSLPWRFVVLGNPGTRRELAERMAGAYAADALAEGQSPEAVRSRNRRSVDRICAAPAAILALADEACLPAAEGRRAEGERLLLIQSVAAAIQNLLLAAHAEGLGACWICAPAFCPQAVRESLGLPESWAAQALVLAGYPDEAPGKPEGRMLGEVVEWR